MYNEDEFLQLSGIQHYIFCKRQWALSYIELQWVDNLRTVEGELLHEKAHNSLSMEKRGNIIISKGMPIHSPTLGISGECDVVEFHRNDKKGTPLHGREGLYEIFPIEYKRGTPKKGDSDILQLTAQAMCLEEMLNTPVVKGYIYYGEIRHRVTIDFNNELFEKAAKIFEEMHNLYKRQHTPRVKRTKSCNACSLQHICLPVLNKNRSAREYIDGRIKEDGI